jgi:hypothetical protein
MTGSITLRGRAAALIGCAALCAVAATASAGSAAAVAGTVHYAPVHLGARADGFNQDGGNWSGYATQHSGITSVSAGWTEPSVTCHSTQDLFAPWVGIDGYGNNTVEQTGVETNCNGGSPHYRAWYEMYPAAPVYYSNAVAAGDVITAKVTRTGTSYTLTVSDKTAGWKQTTVKSLNAQNATAEVIMESPTAAYPDFGKVKFTNAKINGQSLGTYHPDALDASNSRGFEDHTTAITGGTSFAIKFLQE